MTMAAADRGEAPRRARRRFTAEEKADFVRGYDAAPQGQKGAFLRSNGLYSSHIENWRKAPAKQATRAAEKAAGETARLRAENEALKAQLETSQRTVGIGIHFCPSCYRGKWCGSAEPSHLFNEGQGGRRASLVRMVAVLRVYHQPTNPPPAPKISFDGPWYLGGQGTLLLEGPPETETFEWWSSGDTNHRSVAAVAGEAAIVVPVPSTASTYSALTVVAGTTSTTTGQASVSPQGPPAALRRWQFNESSQAATQTAGATGPGLTVTPTSLGSAVGDAGAPDGAFKLGGNSHAWSNAPLLGVAAPTGVTVSLKLQDPASSRGPLVSQDADTGAMFKLTVISDDNGAPKYQVSVATSAGTYSARAPAGTTATGWDWVVASYQPPTPSTGTPGWVQVWSQLDPTAPFTSTAATSIPATAVTLSASGSFRIGAVKSGTATVTTGYIGVVDDTSTWSGTATTSTAGSYF